MNCEYLIIKEDLPFVELIINDSENKNLLNHKIMTEMIRELDFYSKYDACDVVIIAGTGDYFCFGGDIGNDDNNTTESILAFANTLTELHKTIVNFPKITIAAINGKVGGGGVSLVDACDFAIASDKVTFEFPEIHSGRAPMISIMGVRNNLPKKISYEMMFAKIIKSKELLDMGLINRIDYGDDIISSAKLFWGSIPICNLKAFYVCKQYYIQTQNLSYDLQLDVGKHFLVSLLNIESDKHSY